MSISSGFFMALALALAVIFGGQLRDETWGPGMLALGVAMLTAAFGRMRLTKGGWVSLALIAAACGWISWRAWNSPVFEFGRADALLAATLFAGVLWGSFQDGEGKGYRILSVGWAMLAMSNLALCLIQSVDASYSVLFASRPGSFPSGWFGHYNHGADFALVSAAFLGSRALFGGGRRGERVVYGLGSLSGVGTVLFSNSRGGVLALSVSLAILLVLGWLTAWRDNNPRRVPLGLAALAMPLLSAVAVVFFLGQFQEKRGMSGEIQSVADNWSRLTFLEVAWNAATNLPPHGGGSRSFGWLKYQHWDPNNATSGGRDDALVHNELVQVWVDYGWIGAALVALAVVGVLFTSTAGLILRERPDRQADSLVCGGLAAMAGTLVHSNFSFVSHTLPGALYLGLALGFALPKSAGVHPSFSPTFLARSMGLSLAILLVWAGALSSLAFRELWPVSYGKERIVGVAPEQALDRFDRAMEWWPGADLAVRAGHHARMVADRLRISPEERELWLERAETRYAAAARLHPYDPKIVLNHAAVLSMLGRTADDDFEKALSLQGNMETTFRTRFHYARYLYERWYHLWLTERRAEEALDRFHRAEELLGQSKGFPFWGDPKREMTELHAGILRSIRFLEGAGVRPRTPED